MPRITGFSGFVVAICIAFIVAAGCTSDPSPAGTVPATGIPAPSPPGTGTSPQAPATGTLPVTLPTLTTPVPVEATQAGPGDCGADSDCVPANECHPRSCINKAGYRDSGLICTMVCSGPLDCGAGHCACIDRKCTVVPDTGKNPGEPAY